MQIAEKNSWEMTTISIEEGLKTGDIKLLLGNQQNIDTDYVATIAKIKRFLERWSADREFRETLPFDPYGMTRKYNLDIDPEEIRLLWDIEFLQTYDPDRPIPLKVKQYDAYISESLEYRDKVREEGVPLDPLFKAWRSRQIRRISSECGFEKAHSIVHAPFAIELSKGCSVGCWFCGVAAQRLEGIFYYSEDNARLWRQVLEVLREVIGPGASQGFCYWATDPLDNPDYEHFLIDFHAVLNNLPQTTTASAMRNPQRTKNLLKLSKEKNGVVERFSLLTLKEFDKVHQEFSAEELMSVELICQNDEAFGAKAYAGRAREERFRKRVEASNHFHTYDGSYVSDTIACVSGFLLNMVDLTVKLISPCNADETWPLGYRVYDEATFNTASELHIVLKQMIKKHMPLTLSLQHNISFRPDLKYEKDEDAIHLSSQSVKHTFDGTPQLQEIVEFAFGKCQTVAELALLLEREKGIDLTQTLYYLNQMFQESMIEHSPHKEIG
ncbi:radical SAM family RiPP maturation amino acid epimerase [Nostoc sp.]|uniref:radical SAM family RiPP maturation amino acid epimerase n=1 Tax=Nostoc sp. TaxID=1180 RepID=UPI002FF6E12F